MIYAWLKRHEHLATWIQGLGVMVALAFGVVQLREARQAVEYGSAANAIALKARLDDLVVKINEIALDHPEIRSGYPPEERIQLIRMEYFFEVYNMHKVHLLGEDRFAAEGRYLRWAAAQPSFRAAWRTAGDQYPSPFRHWVDGILGTVDEPVEHRATQNIKVQ